MVVLGNAVDVTARGATGTRMGRAENYVTGRMHAMPGYLTQADARIMLALLRDQTARGVTGAIGEIGIYYGRSCYLLEMLRQDGERLVACDLFPGGTEGRQYRAFVDQARGLGLSVNLGDIHRIGSAELDPGALCADVGPVRFWHIDGNHRRTFVLGDAALAEASLHQAGIIVFDDFCTPLWPEVTQGVFEFLAASDDFVIFAISRKKAYVARASHAHACGDVIRADRHLKPARRDEVRLKHGSVPFVNETVPAIVRQKINDAIGRGPLPVLL